MRATTYGWQACRRIHVGASVWVGVGLRNVNLEQYARRDQIARVSRATVAEAMTWASGHGQRACDRHLQICCEHGGDDFETSLFGS